MKQTVHRRRFLISKVASRSRQSTHVSTEAFIVGLSQVQDVQYRQRCALAMSSFSVCIAGKVLSQNVEGYIFHLGMEFQLGLS